MNFLRECLVRMNKIQQIHLKKFRPQQKFAFIVCALMVFFLYGFGVAGPGLGIKEWGMGLSPFVILMNSLNKALRDKKNISSGNYVEADVEDRSSEFFVSFKIENCKHEIKITKSHVLFPFMYYRPEDLSYTSKVKIFFKNHDTKNFTILEQSFWEIL